MPAQGQALGSQIRTLSSSVQEAAAESSVQWGAGQLGSNMNRAVQSTFGTASEALQAPAQSPEGAAANKYRCISFLSLAQYIGAQPVGPTFSYGADDDAGR